MITDVKDLYSVEIIDKDAVISVQIPVANGMDVYIFEGENITEAVSAYNRGKKIYARGLHLNFKNKK